MSDVTDLWHRGGFALPEQVSREIIAMARAGAAVVDERSQDDDRPRQEPDSE